jgi:hypothetical protein
MIPPRSPTKVTARSSGTEGEVRARCEPETEPKADPDRDGAFVDQGDVRHYGHLFVDNEADQRAADCVEFRLLGA